MKQIAMFVTLVTTAAAAYAQDGSGGAVYFPDPFPSFATEQEAQTAIGSPGAGRDALLRAGNYYWMLGTTQGMDMARKREYCRKAVDALEALWKRDRRDNEVCLYLGYAYMGLTGATPLAELDALLSSVNRAQNLFGMVVARLERNMDARLARTLINMNLTPQTGRPDALILEDADVYFAGYEAMGREMREHAYYYMGAQEMWLARALVYHDQRKRVEAEAAFRKIDATVLAAEFRKLMTPLERVYGR